MAAVVSHDKRDLILAGGPILTHELGDVDARDSIRRHGPTGRNSPVAGVHFTGRRIAQRRRLVLHARVLKRGDLTGAHAAIVAEPVNIDPIIVRIRIDLEVDRGAVIDADVGRESLDIRIARAVDAPLAFRIAEPLVLQNDRIGRRCRSREEIRRDFRGKCGFDLRNHTAAVTVPDRIPICPVIEPVPVSPPPPGSCPFQSAKGATCRDNIGSLIEPARIRF